MQKIQEIKQKVGQDAKHIIANGLNLQSKNKNFRCPNVHAHKRGDKVPSMGWDDNALHFYCFACNMKIDIYGYYREHLNYKHNDIVADILGENGTSKLEKERETFASEVEKVLPLNDKCKKYIEARGISLDTAKAFDVGMYKGDIAFKYAKFDTVVGYKIRKAERICSGLKMYSMTGSKPFLFNFNNIDLNESEIIFCEGEFDCMVLWQCGFKNVVSVGAGANSLASVLEQADEYINKFSNIIVISDNDDAGDNMDAEFVKRYGLKARLVDKNLYKMNDINEEYFKFGEDKIKEIVKSARLKIEGRRDLDVEPYESMKKKSSTYIPTGIDELDYAMNDLVSGCVSVIVGKTNAGKTTFTKQIIANAIDKGNKVFCVSGEGDINIFINEIYKTVIGNDKDNYNVIKQNKRFYKEPKQKILNKLREWHKGKFVLFSKGDSNLKSVDELFEALAYEIKTHHHNLVVLDNLMSLLTISESKEKNDAQGEFVQRCCDLAKAYNTHILLVVHPRKGYEKNINVESISGSMDIGNKADNVISVGRSYNKDEAHDGTIKLLKNRYFSDLVEVKTIFHQETGLLLGIDKDTNIAKGYSFNFNGGVDELGISIDNPF